MQKASNIAKWFLAQEPMTHKKLQKLCYYAQAWHCALYGKPLFEDEIQAWVHGPVVVSLYPLYAGYGWETIPQGKPIKSIKGKKALKILDAVYETYKMLSGDQLERLTHSEEPWKKARGNSKPWENCNTVISLESMKRYYKEKYEQAQGE
ncbi:MAG: DUF4065 domain-containing protein [Selenomonadaceae bacterium]|nr:DUF4065 domain-containing protein [Selenomonadaceae bacterium]